LLTVKANIRYFLHRPLQLILTIFGIALGVSVVSAVDLANTSAQQAFRLSMAEVMGNTTHHIVGNTIEGIPEVRYRDLRFQFGRYSQLKSTPLVEGVVRINDQHFRLLGVDIFTERDFRANISAPKSGSLYKLITQPNTILMSDTDAQRLGIVTGDKVALRTGSSKIDAEVVGTINSAVPAAAESLIICDIATAQEILGRVGYLDRIDLIIPPDDPELLVAVKNWLPRSVHLENAFSHSNTRLQTTRAFQINLQAMSLMAVLVGGFLIFNTLTFSILQRRKLIGIMRGIGVTRTQIFGQIIIESLLLGLIGSVIGILLGIAIGSGLIKLVLRTINDLYFVVNVSSLTISPLSLIKAFSIGILVSVVAALSPAWEAAGTSPVTAQHRSALEKHIHSSMSVVLMVGFGIMVVSAVCLILSNELVLAFSWLFLFVVGYCVSLAPTIILLFKALSPLLKKTNLLVRLAIRSIPASLSRTSVAIAALTVAVSATIGIGVMVHSFRYSVEHWLHNTLSGDIYLSAPETSSGRALSTLPAHITNRLRGLEGVREVTHVRRVKINSNLGELQVLAIKPAADLSNRPPLLHGNPRDVWPLFDRGKIILVSEPFSRRFHVKKDSLVELYTDKGRQKFVVGGVVQDYRSDQGMIMIDRLFYNRHWKDTAVSAVAIFLNEDGDLEKVKTEVADAIKEFPGIVINSTQEIYHSSLEIFDRTFTITDVLRLLAVGVAFFGVFSALLAFQLERIREIAVLRATGMTNRQVWVVIGTHTAIIGFLSGLFAIPLGIVLAWILVNVINEIAFGWSMDMIIPLGTIAQGMVIAVLASVLAAIYPSWKLSSISPARALREE